MSSSTRLGLLAAAWLVAAAGTPAQPAPAPSAVKAGGGADPLQPGAAVPPAAYTSPLARYRAARDVEVGSWREVNDTVTRIGGWRAYAREASQPDAPPPAPAAISSPATPSHGKP
jgi:hypothetical protein